MASALGSRSLAALLARRAWRQGLGSDARSIHNQARSLSTGGFRPAGTGPQTGPGPRGAMLALSAALGLGAGWYALLQPSPSLAKSAEDLPEYSKEEVAEHRSKDSVWVTYKDGVYDVTKWVDIHPGGASRIMLAAGGAIDPFWSMYQQHNTAQVREILEEYRIGRLQGGAPPPPEDPYANDPKDRLPVFIVRSEKPMNAEPPRELLTGSLITPTELFYIRNHLPVPEIDPKEHALRVCGEGLKELNLSLEELRRRFKWHTVTATVQCSGNRRDEFNGVEVVKGLEWSGAAIGTAVWGGVRLADVLRAAGLRAEDETDGEHVQFVGADADISGSRYAASIPLHRALDPRADVLLALEMNGAPLTRDHGAPLRVVVPGTAGCRSVKWVTDVVVSRDEADSLWQRRDYKSFSPSTTWDDVDWESAPAIQVMPITSLICEPAPGTAVEPGDAVAVRGYAWSGGGSRIVRVDVSVDGGKSWRVADLNKVPQQSGRAWAWTLWELEVEVPADAHGDFVVVAKATDENYNTQPESPASIWNIRGVNCHSWPQLKLKVERDS